MRSVDERVRFYIGELYDHASIDLQSRYNLEDNHNYIKNYKAGKIDLLLAQIQATGNDPNAFYWDNFEANNTMPSYVLSRARFDGSSVLVNSLLYERMWWDFYNPPKDRDFLKKDSKVFWRGAPSGHDFITTDMKSTRRAYRAILLRDHFNTENIDVGVCFNTTIHANILKSIDIDINYYKKPPVSKEQFLNHKYILSIEGNDNDSGLRWKLNSNSIVLMPNPRCYTWLIESQLSPYVHYVPVSNDFSDLQEKFEWCQDNQQECLEIINNAHKYMQQFNDESREQEIERRVIAQYYKIINDIKR
jgi:hypothetical protein